MSRIVNRPAVTQAILGVPMVLMAFAALLLGVVNVSAESNPSATRHALQSACFAPGTLKAIPGEEQVQKGDRRFSAPPARTAVIAAEPVPPDLRGSIRRVDLPPGLKLVALTFDLCELSHEIAGYEGRIIDTLRKENVKATLFAGGKWMRSHVARTQQLMSDPLFEIANHAEAHRNLRLLSGEALSDEILGPERAWEDIRRRLSQNQCAAAVPDAMQAIPQRLTLFRFPYGACNPQALEAVNGAGMLAIQWDVSTGDPSPGTTAQAIVHTAIKRVKPGSILIAHANGRGWHTPDALPLAIAALKKEGYTFVTVSELLAAGKPVIAETCYDNRPGDSDRYDHFTSLMGANRSKAANPDTSWGTTTVKPARKGTRHYVAKPARPRSPD
ncbi:MAG TPA: polysaccharide deacetylase family protein [Hyphomicrobium sp.]|nr:polysaccharide deacetylase family protein [Hyphomicrobium sp.]